MDTPISAKAALLTELISGTGYGLDLIDRVREHTKGAVNLNEGSVYPALRALEKEGLVRSFEGEPLPERGGRPRRYYELTAQGLRQAHRQTTGLAAFFAALAPART